MPAQLVSKVATWVNYQQKQNVVSAGSSFVRAQLESQRLINTRNALATALRAWRPAVMCGFVSDGDPNNVHPIYDKSHQLSLASVFLSGANLREVCLPHVDFSCAYLQDTNFGIANLYHSDFKDAHLQYAHMACAKLEDASFSWANLENANLSGAVVLGAHLYTAKLKNADMRNIFAINREGQHMCKIGSNSEAILDDETRKLFDTATYR